MLKPIPEYLRYFLSDCLGEDSSYTVKSMFGGYGIYKHNKIFALYAWDIIYMKTHEKNIQD
jgi:DNA transformation protein